MTSSLRKKHRFSIIRPWFNSRINYIGFMFQFYQFLIDFDDENSIGDHLSFHRLIVFLFERIITVL